MYLQFQFDCNEQDFKEFRDISLDSLFVKRFGRTGEACDLLKVNFSNISENVENQPQKKNISL